MQSTWKISNWKWVSAVQLLASEGCVIGSVLARCKCGERFITVVCAPFHTQTAQTLQPITLHGYSFATGSWATSSSTWKVHSPTKLHSTIQRLTDGIHTSGHSVIFTHQQQHNLRTVFQLTFGAVVLEVKSCDRLYLKSSWHSRATSVSWKRSCQCF